MPTTKLRDPSLYVVCPACDGTRYLPREIGVDAPAEKCRACDGGVVLRNPPKEAPMPSPLPPRCVGHIQQALDHLRLAQHYVDACGLHKIHPLAASLDNATRQTHSAEQYAAAQVKKDDGHPELANPHPHAVVEGELGTVRMSQVEFDALIEYSTSLPTGVVAGKRWKRLGMTAWLLGEYTRYVGPASMGITWSKIEIIS